MHFAVNKGLCCVLAICKRNRESIEAPVIRAGIGLGKEHKARIVLANLVTRNDSLDMFTAPQMTVRSYNRLAGRLRYRTEPLRVCRPLCLSVPGVCLAAAQNAVR